MGTKTGQFFEGSHIPGWEIASVFRRIARTRLGHCISISKHHTYPIVGAYRIRPTPRPRRGRKQDSFLKSCTYPVRELHRYFEGSHVPDCRGVSNTPTKRHRWWRIQIRFLNPRTYPVGGSHRYFEGSHVPDCRGVCNTPHKRPRRERKRGSFLKGRTYPVVGAYRIRPTDGPEGDENGIVF